jgi:hypothetical protein
MVGDRLDFHSQAPTAPIKPDRWKHAAGMLGHWCAVLLAEGESGPHNYVAIHLVRRRRHEINPIGKPRPCLAQHSLAELPRDRRPHAKFIYQPVHNRARQRLRLPFKGPLCRRCHFGMHRKPAPLWR